MPTYVEKTNAPDGKLAQKAAAALRGSVKLSNEIIGTMELIDRGIRPTPGMVSAMRSYIKAATIFINEIDC